MSHLKVYLKYYRQSEWTCCFRLLPRRWVLYIYGTVWRQYGRTKRLLTYQSTNLHGVIS